MTNKMRLYFLRVGHPESDLPQINEAFGHIKLSVIDERTGKEVRIDRRKAVDLLGAETFYSGVSRAAFHATAAREGCGGKVVYFDCHDWLFR